MSSNPPSDLRRRARMLYLITELVLLAALVVAVQATLAGRERAQRIHNDALYGAPLALLDINRQLQSEKALQLMAFPPPADMETRVEWSDAIREHMGFPVAIFVKSDSALHWMRVPDFLLPRTADVPQALDASLPDDQHAQVDSLGLLVIWRGTLGPDTAAAMLTAFTQRQSGTGWGIMYQPADGLTPLFESLAEGASHPRRLLRGILQTDSSASSRTRHTGLRAFWERELLYATPGVDTTRDHREIEWGNLRAQFFLSDQDLLRMREARGLGLPAALLILALMVVVWTFHRWLQRSTNP